MGRDRMADVLAGLAAVAALVILALLLGLW